MIDAKNAALIVAVLVVAGIVGLYIPYMQYKNQSFTTREVLEGGEAERVFYTNRGFEPARIAINVGATVEWVNESDKQLWVASDPHPSHTDLPGFDERGVEGSDLEGFVPVAYAHSTGSLYRYTFTKIGEWSYHNHLAPMDRATVFVE